MDNVKVRKLLRLTYSIIFNVIILLMALYFFKPFFEEIDDTHISMIAEGAYGKCEEHLIYVNIILGKLYSVLYGMFSTVRWHTVLQYAMILLGYIAFVYVMSKNLFGTTLSSIIVFATFYEMYVSLQYTKTAAFLSAVACILVFQSARKYKEGKIADFFSEKNKDEEGAEQVCCIAKKLRIISEGKYLLIALFFATYAGLLRFEAFFIGLVPMLGILITEFLRTRARYRYICFFAIALIVVTSLSTIDRVNYRTDTEWNDFKKYNKARMMLTDYRYDVLYYERYGAKLNEMGVSENDAFMILTYQFADSDVYNTEYYNNIISQFDAKKINKSFFKNFYDALVDEIKRMSPILPIIIIVFIYLVIILSLKLKWEGIELHTDSKRMIIGIFITCISVASAIFYFAYSGRISHRLIASIVISTLIGVVYVIDSSDFIKNEQEAFSYKVMHITGSFLMAIMVVSIGFNALNYFISLSDYHTNKKKCEREIDEFERMSEDKEHLYVIDTFTFQNTFKYAVFESVEKGKYDNVVSTGSWFSNSPITNNVCRNFKYNNPYEAIIHSRGDVFLEDSDFIVYKQQFIKEHYNKEIIFETEDSINSVGKFRPYRLN